MNRTTLVVLVVASALMAASVASADSPINFSVLDQLGNVVVAPVAAKLYERQIGGSFTVTDSALVATRTFSSGTGQINARIPQDFTGDGEVGFDDFFLLASAFGSKRGDTGPSGYVEAIDLVRNDKIDFDDFFKFVEAWEQSYVSTRFSLHVESADTLFTPRDTSFVGVPTKPIVLAVRVNDLRGLLTAFVVGDTSRIFVGDTLKVLVVQNKYYGTRLVGRDTLQGTGPKGFILSGVVGGVEPISGNRLWVRGAGTFRVSIQSSPDMGSIVTSFSVTVRSLRQVLDVSFPLGRNTVALGDSTGLTGLVHTFWDTLLVSKTSVPLDSLKITVGLKTRGHLIFGEKVGTFTGTAEYHGLTASFQLTVNPPPDSTPPTIRLAVDVKNNRLTLAVSDSSGQVAVKMTQDGTSLLSGTFAKLDTSLGVSLRDLTQPVFRIDAADKYGNKALRDTMVSVPDRTAPYAFVRVSGTSIDAGGKLHIDKAWFWDGGSGLNDRAKPSVLTFTVRTPDGKEVSLPVDMYVTNTDTLQVYQKDVSGFASNAGTAARTVTGTAAVKDRAGNTGQYVFQLTQPGTPAPPPPPPPATEPPPPPPPANVAPSFTTATATVGSKSYAAGSSFSTTLGDVITFNVAATGTPTPTISLLYSEDNGVTWKGAKNPFNPEKAKGYRVQAVASNGVPKDAVATWTIDVQLPP